MLTLTAIAQHRYRVIILSIGLLLSVGICYLLFGPRTPKGADYRFMHCKTCKTEREYDGKSTEARCNTCKKTITFIPTVESIKKVGNPWRSFSVAVAIAVVVYLGLLVYLVRPRTDESKPAFLYCNCPKCRWRLRFRATSAGKDGQCPRCKKMFLFPIAEAADEHEFPHGKQQEPVEAWPEH